MFDLPAVVLDVGTHSIKAGVAGPDAPSHVIQNIVGRPKYRRLIKRRHPEPLYCGAETEDTRGVLELSYPMFRGSLKDGSSAKLDETGVLRHVYEKLGVRRDERAVVVTCSCLGSVEHLRTISEILFEQLSVPGVFFSLAPILSLYSTGDVTGIVLDCGEGMSQTAAMYDGYLVNSSVKRIDVGGMDVTRYLARLLRVTHYGYTPTNQTSSASARALRRPPVWSGSGLVRTPGKPVFAPLWSLSSPGAVWSESIRGGYNFHTTAEMEIIREIKEGKDLLYVARNFAKEATQMAVDSAKFKLPDGSDVQIQTERYKAPEVLFNPSMVGMECPGVAGLVVDAIRACDIDIRASLCENITLAGGSTLFHDFCERLLFNVKDGLPRDLKVIVKAPVERKYTAWIGGGILSSLRSFGESVTTAEQFRESGMVDIVKKSYV